MITNLISDAYTEGHHYCFIAHAVLHCIAVAPSHRHQGLDDALIQAVSSQFELQSLTAETDLEAVDFYKHCGFEITSLGEVYPGTERFCCVLIRKEWTTYL